MSGNLISQFGSFCNGMFKKATAAVENHEAGFVRGKVASSALMDYRGRLIVRAGQTIDDSVIEQAQAAGKLGALVSTTVASQARNLYESTPDRIEARSLATSEDYIDARRYIGWTAATDVTDIQGTVLVPAGKQIEDEDVRIAREADQLAALVFSAQQSGMPAPGTFMPVSTPAREEYEEEEVLTPAAVSHRTARPLASYFEDETVEAC